VSNQGVDAVLDQSHAEPTWAQRISVHPRRAVGHAQRNRRATRGVAAPKRRSRTRIASALLPEIIAGKPWYP